MDIETPRDESGPRSTVGRAVRRQMLGSGLLLLGRLVSLGLNFLRNVLIARYLTTLEFGAFSYALSMVAFLNPFATVGLKTTVPRFLPIFHERRQFEKVVGTLLLGITLVLLVSGTVITLFTIQPAWMGSLLTRERLPLLFLSVMIFLVPFEAIDVILVNFFASFGEIRSIFIRKFLAGPILKFSVVAALILTGSSAFLLAWGYLFAGCIGTAISIRITVVLFRRHGLSDYFRLGAIRRVPKEVFHFTLPAFTSEVAPHIVHSMNVILIAMFHSASEVAFYTVIMPLANLNFVVIQSIVPIYIPSASRLFARKDMNGIREYYWHTAVWTTILSFPIFAATFGMARPLTLLFFGSKYAESAFLLAIVSVGFFFSITLGCNMETLKVLGRNRFIVSVDIIVIVVNLGLNLYLIPRYGALGAAYGTALTTIFQNIVRQIGLKIFLGLRHLEGRLILYYSSLMLSAAALFATQFLFEDSVLITGALAGAISLIMFLVTKRFLKIEETFPELLKLPVLKYLVVSGK